MATDAKERNRKNALRSTGPRTAEGKAIVSVNRFSHGLRSKREVIPGESAEEYESFLQTVQSDLRASNATEQALSGLVASHLWRLARGAKYEAEAIRQNLEGPALEKAYNEYTRGLPDCSRPMTCHELDKTARKLKKEEKKARTCRKLAALVENIDTTDDEKPIDIEELSGVAEYIPNCSDSIVKYVLQFIHCQPRAKHLKVILKADGVKAAVIQRLRRAEKLHMKVIDIQCDIYQRQHKTYKKALKEFKARHAALGAEDVSRLQQYESHLHRNLQRTLESFAKLRELQKIEPMNDIPVVALNVKTGA